MVHCLCRLSNATLTTPSIWKGQPLEVGTVCATSLTFQVSGREKWRTQPCTNEDLQPRRCGTFAASVESLVVQGKCECINGTHFLLAHASGTQKAFAHPKMHTLHSLWSYARLHGGLTLEEMAIALYWHFGNLSYGWGGQ